MTLFAVVNAFLNIAEMQPNILYAGEGDIYEALNGHQDVTYPVFFITQKEHTENTENTDFINYKLDLFVIDREVSDKSNKLYLQSHAISTLSNIIKKARQYFDVSSVVYHTFEEKFDSICAGAFAEIIVEGLDETECPYDYIEPEPEG